MTPFHPESDKKRSECRRIVFAVITISVMVLSIYSNTFHGSWHFDDEQNIQDNPGLHLTALSWNDLKKTFFASPDGSGKLYRPIACLSFALNYYFGKTHVFGYHLVNIIIHIIASVFLFLFLYSALGLPLLSIRYGPDTYLIALLSSVLWAVNPVQTQAITYIVQRMASLAAMFYIMSMFFYLKARTSGQPFSRTGFYAACFVSGVLAFGSKENAAMLPFSLVLFDLFLIQGATWKNIKKNAAVMVILVCIPLALALLLRGASFFTVSHLLSGYEERGFTVGQRLLTEPRILIFYISLLFYPMPNRMSITHVISPSSGLFQPFTTLPSMILILLILSWALIKSKKRPLVCYSVVFFFLNHVIESSVFPLELIFEHRNYLPSMLFFVPMSILFAGSIKLFSGKTGMQSAITVLLLSILIGFGHGTFVRNFTWKTEESLWIDAVDKNPDSIRAHHNLGRHYSNSGQRKKAISEYTKALKLRPEAYGERSYLTHYNLALDYMKTGENAKAKQHLKEAIASFPRFADAYCNLAVLMTKEGEYEKANENLIKSLTYNRNSPQAHNNLGYVLLKRRRFDEAIAEFQKALKLKKGYAVAERNLGIAHKHKKEFRLAIHYLKSVIEKNPKDLLTRFHLAEAYSLAGKNESATRILTRTLDLFGPERLYRMLGRLFKDNASKELPDKTVVLPLIEKSYRDRALSLKRKGDNLLKLEETF